MHDIPEEAKAAKDGGMAKLERKSRTVAEEVRKFEKTAQQIHVMANNLHKKMEKLHMKARGSARTRTGETKHTGDTFSGAEQPLQKGELKRGSQ